MIQLNRTNGGEGCGWILVNLAARHQRVKGVADAVAIRIDQTVEFESPPLVRVEIAHVLADGQGYGLTEDQPVRFEIIDRQSLSQSRVGANRKVDLGISHYGLGNGDGGVCSQISGVDLNSEVSVGSRDCSPVGAGDLGSGGTVGSAGDRIPGNAVGDNPLDQDLLAP